MHRLVAVGFDHMHIGDQLRTAMAQPGLELVGAVDTDAVRMRQVCESVGLAQLPQVSEPTEVDAALDAWAPDLAVVCSTTAGHRAWVERLAPRGVTVLLEKPFGRDLADVDAIIAISRAAGTTLAVNWPSAWYPTHRTAYRLIADGEIGTITEVHYYGGNRGPLHHLHDKIEVSPTEPEKARSWWYSAAAGGGSLLDYLGYGTTLGTWFRGGDVPSAVTAAAHVPAGLQVDEQSVVVASYPGGLSSFATRWGTFTDPWSHRTQPRTGFVLVGTAGTLSSFDYTGYVTLQNAAHLDGVRVPPEELPPELSSGLGALLHSLDSGGLLDGTLSVDTGRVGQLVVDAAVLSAQTGHRVEIDGHGPDANLRIPSATRSTGSTDI